MDAVKTRSIRVTIPELLKERGWTITEFMRRSGLSYPTAHRLSHGHVTALTLDTIDKLCEVFDVTVDMLIVRGVGTD